MSFFEPSEPPQRPRGPVRVAEKIVLQFSNVHDKFLFRFCATNRKDPMTATQTTPTLRDLLRRICALLAALLGPIGAVERRRGVLSQRVALPGRGWIHQPAVPSAAQHGMVLRRRGTFLIEGSAFTQGGPASSAGQRCCESADYPPRTPQASRGLLP